LGLAAALRLRRPPQAKPSTELRQRRRRREMEVEMQLDDDVFYAELSKRISLLITDDDDADFASVAAAQFPVDMHLPPVSSLHLPFSLARSLLVPVISPYHPCLMHGCCELPELDRSG
jgi:hypothetical protein